MTWNEFAKESQAILDSRIGGPVISALTAGGWPATLAQTPLPEITQEIRPSLGQQMVDRITSPKTSECIRLMFGRGIGGCRSGGVRGICTVV